MAEQLPNTRDDPAAAEFAAYWVVPLINRVATSRDCRLNWSEDLVEGLEDMGNPDYTLSQNEAENRYRMQRANKRRLNMASLYAEYERLDRQILGRGIENALKHYVMAKTLGAI